MVVRSLSQLRENERVVSEITTKPNDSKAFQVIVNLDVFEMYDALVSKKKMKTKPKM